MCSQSGNLRRVSPLEGCTGRQGSGRVRSLSHLQLCTQAAGVSLIQAAQSHSNLGKFLQAVPKERVTGTLPLSSEPRMAEQVFLRLPSLCVLSQILPFVRTLVNTWSPPRYSKLSPYFKVRRLAMYLFLALTYSLFFLISLCIYRLCWVFAAVCRLLQLQRTGSLALCVGSAVVAHGFSCPVACGIFIPQPGIESMAPALEDKFLTTGPPGKS